MQAPKPVIALVDDDRNILMSVTMFLEAEGFAVDTYSDGEAGLRGLTTRGADLAIVDIKMPRMNGVELLQKLRERTQMPVIILSSKDEEIDQILGLRLGADDYITKPFSQRLLLARIQVLLRRHNLATHKVEPTREEASVITRGELQIDEGRHRCLWRGRDVQLTVTEFLLLKTLALRPGVVKTRDQLMDAAYGDNINVDDRTIDSHIKRLRRKFKVCDEAFNQIETLYGVGYRYREEG